MLDIRLLGQFALFQDGAPVELSSRPAQSLLAYLLLNRDAAHRRERLAGLLWPDSNEASARRNLRQALWQIRRALGETADKLVQADDVTITAQLRTDHRLDVALLERPVAEPAVAETLIEQVAVYAGELLPGFYDDWIVLERERLQAQFERVMERLLDCLTEQGRWSEILEWSEFWLSYGSTPEPAYRAAMLAYAALGDMARMAELYRRCVETLERELGVEPSEQTRQLFERLRHGDTGLLPLPPAASPSSPAFVGPIHNLPVHLTSFIGRETEIASIRRLLPEHRLVTLTGSGGTGKTRLALQVAQSFLTEGPAGVKAAPPFVDGIWLVELALLNDPDAVARTVATVLGVREEDCCSLTQLLVDYLRPRQLLLILDNCEHLLDACARLVDALLRACPRLTILTTGREMLGLIGEMVLRVPSLSLPAATPLPSPSQLLDYEAICLFVERATAVRPDFQMNEQNAPAIVHICRQLDGVPLAIELAAARVRAMTPEQISARLDDRFRLLTGGSRTALPRQQTLRALIDWSWGLLTDQERTLLRRLAVFRGGWTLDAAEQVGADADRQPLIHQGDVLDLLTHLVDKSLVVIQEQLGETRYDLLETIRQYALEQLIEAGESETVRSAHLTYFLSIAEQAEPKLRTGEQLHWLARLQVEHDNLRAALAWAAATEDPETGLQLAGALSRYWYLRGHWTEGRAWLKQMLAGVDATEEQPESLVRARIHALCGAGWLADEDGSEIPLYSESLTLSRQIGSRWCEAFALRGLSAITTNWANLEQAGPQLERSLALFTELGEEWGIALVRFTQGWLALELDKPGDAETLWQESLRRFQQTGDRWGIGVTLGALGYVARGRNEYDRAGQLMHESLRVFRELGDKAGVGLLLTRLGNLAFRRADYREATALLNEGMAVIQDRHDIQGLIATLQVQGMVAAFQGDYGRAQGLFQQSIEYARSRGIKYELGHSLSYLAYTHYLCNELEQAATLFAEGLTHFEQEQDREGMAFAHYGLGLVTLRQGKYDQAAHWFHLSLERYRTRGDKRYLAQVLDGLGNLALAQGDRPTALAHFRESLALRKSILDKQGLAESLEQFALATPNPITGVHLLAAADGLRRTIGAPLPPVEQARHNGLLNNARTILGEAGFTAAWAAGQAQAYEQAIQVAWAEGELQVV